MDRELSREALRIFEQTMDLGDTQRAAVLDKACRDNAPLRQKVESLLAAQGQATDLLPSIEHEDDDALTESDTHQHPSLAKHFTKGTLLADRYRILEVIGTGGMGDVYRATDNRLDRQVAIKTLNDSSVRHKEMHQRFDREMKSVAALSHPNIVTLFDVVHHDELTFAVMEVVDGRTLREFIQDRPHWTTSARLVRDVAMGLVAAHEQDTMHRDIKPENVIVDVDHSAKILDFGLARPEVPSSNQNITTTDMVAGTVPYMSPEQAESRDLTCATDIFSLGTVLYELLAGSNPFRADGFLQTMKRVATAQPAPVRSETSDIPDGLAILLETMHSHDPLQRPTASQVATQLSSLIDAADNSSTAAASQAVNRADPNAKRSVDWQPSLIILPFQTFGDAPDLTSTADALVENLSTVLTRIPMLSLTSRAASFALRQQPHTADEIHRRFGVDYMLEGSIQQFGSQLRANVQLTAAHNAFQLWAQHFDCPSGSAAVPSLLRSVLSRLEPQLIRAMFNDLGNETEELSSRQLLIQSMSVLSLKGWHVDSFNEVADLLRRSIAMDPRYALTHAYFALIRGLGKRVGLVADPVAAARDAVHHAEQALDLEDMDSNVLGLAGCALSDVGEPDRAIPILRNAIDINPNNAQAHAALGAALLAVEECNEAIDHLQTGIDISPLDARLAVWYAMLSIAHLRCNAPDQAREAARRGCQSDRKNYMPRVVLTAVHLMSQDNENAQRALRESLRVKPDLTQDEIDSLIGPEAGQALSEFRQGCSL